MVFLLCWLISYPAASWVELYSQFQVENSVLPSSYFPSWHPISLCFSHKVEENKTVLILSPNTGIAFSCNWCNCPLQNEDGKRHPSTCFGRWYQDNSKVSLPFACQKVCFNYPPFFPSRETQLSFCYRNKTCYLLHERNSCPWWAIFQLKFITNSKLYLFLG